MIWYDAFLFLLEWLSRGSHIRKLCLKPFLYFRIIKRKWRQRLLFTYMNIFLPLSPSHLHTRTNRHYREYISRVLRNFQISPKKPGLIFTKFKFCNNCWLRAAAWQSWLLCSNLVADKKFWFCLHQFCRVLTLEHHLLIFVYYKMMSDPTGHVATNP